MGGVSPDRCSLIGVLQKGSTALMFAIEEDIPEMVKELLNETTIDVNAANKVAMGMCVGYAWPQQGENV